jgi:hypothetical protein
MDRVSKTLFFIDALVKGRKTMFSVIPAEAGIQKNQGVLDPGFRRGDGLEDFLRTHLFWIPSRSEGWNSRNMKPERKGTSPYDHEVHVLGFYLPVSIPEFSYGAYR